MASVKGQELLEAGEEDEQENMGAVRAVKLLRMKLQQWARVGTVSKPTEGPTPEWAPQEAVDSGRWRVQAGSLTVTGVPAVITEEAVRALRGVAGTRETSAPSSFCCKPKTALL